jgi:hypothetical protein
MGLSGKVDAGAAGFRGAEERDGQKKTDRIEGVPAEGGVVRFLCESSSGRTRRAAGADAEARLLRSIGAGLFALCIDSGVVFLP